MHQGTSDVGFIPSKDKFPNALHSYIVRNQDNHGCSFAGRRRALQQQRDRAEWRQVVLVLKDYDMYHTNSCEYE
eukprot:4797741-Pleurochrysis_carterae.AAC.1